MTYNYLNTYSGGDAESAEVERAFREVRDAYLASNHRKKIEIIDRAFQFARHAHRGARRSSGEPYILHPIAVAKIVITELGLGSTSICAALLHDVVEDTEYTREDIEGNFGSKIASIVEGLTKISGGIFGDKASLQAQNFRKLLLSMSTDIRVVLIKMADRLHNMRTLGSLRPEKQFKIAGETLYVYAPLAHRLGLFKIKTELEDLAFKYEHPAKYAEIMSKISESEEYRNRVVERFVAPVRDKLDAAGYKYEIKARVKSAYSIYNKMEHKKIPFEEIYDIYAVRVIFENDDEDKERVRCWEIYTFFSDGHKVHPDRMRDWTSIPKSNGYRALHLTTMGPDGKWIEVQIRSRKMDEIAELGYAAHWKYKTGETDDDTELDKWMNTIKEILANPEPNTIDFLDSIKLNLYSSEIYVFTPKGDLITLPSGSTVLDFAFEIHSELGAHCIAGKINHRLEPLNYRLDSGDQIEIITSKTQQPKPEWLNWCHTAKTKNTLRQLLRRDREAMRERGKHQLDDYLEKHKIERREEIPELLMKQYGVKTVDDMYVRLGRDEISLSPQRLLQQENKQTSIIRKLLFNPFSTKKRDSSPPEIKEEKIAAIDRTQPYVLLPDRQKPNYALDTCCSPVPGDDVLGFIDDDGRVVVHKVNCGKAMLLKTGYGTRLLTTVWGAKAASFQVRLRVQGIDRQGMIHEITELISNKLKLDIRGMTIKARNEVFDCKITVRVDTTETIDNLIHRLKDLKGIKIAQRIS